MSDALGERGEDLFKVIMTHYDTVDGVAQARFHPCFLGDKWPLVDFFVEVVGAGAETPFFLAQVKATRAGYTETGRLKVDVPASDIRRLAAYPAPTYIIGIDETKTDDLENAGYILSANGETPRGIGSLTTRYPINADHRALLWQEVRDYWLSVAATSRLTSRFADR